MAMSSTPKWSPGLAQNLPAEINDFNAVTATNNPAAIKFAVQALSAKWKGAEGYEAPLVTGRRLL